MVEYNSSSNIESMTYLPYFSHIFQLMVASPLPLFIHEQYCEQFQIEWFMLEINERINPTLEKKF